MDTEKIKKIWNVVKQIIEVIIGAIAGYFGAGFINS